MIYNYFSGTTVNNHTGNYMFYIVNRFKRVDKTKERSLSQKTGHSDDV
jgi:hypothetical protein